MLELPLAESSRGHPLNRSEKPQHFKRTIGKDLESSFSREGGTCQVTFVHT